MQLDPRHYEAIKNTNLKFLQTENEFHAFFKAPQIEQKQLTFNTN